MKKSLILMGIVLILFIYSPASSQDNDLLTTLEKEPDLQGYKILAVSSLMFKPLVAEQYQMYDWTLNEVGLTFRAGNPGNLSFFTQVHLPDGAEIKRVVAVYYDNSALANIEIAIGRAKPLDLAEPEEMIYFSSEGLANNTDLRVYSTSTILYPIIDNRNIYMAMVDFDQDTDEDVAFRCLYIAYE
jgi:hypothetical protein